MAHIHEKIASRSRSSPLRRKGSVIHHRKLESGCRSRHIELDEDPEQAAPARGEGGKRLDVELLGERPPRPRPARARSSRRSFLDIHRISDTHEHIGRFTGRGSSIPPA